MNNVSLIGRLVKEVEVKMANNNKTFARFTLAVNRPFKNKEGKYDADFINCIAFDQKADFLQKYASKGNKVAICGEIRTGKYEKNGQTIYTTDVIANSVELLETPKAEEKTTEKAKEIDVDDLFY